MDAQTEELRSSYQRFFRVGLLLAVSPLFYVAAVEFLKNVEDPFTGILAGSPSLVPTLRYALIVLAAADTAMLWYLRGRALLPTAGVGYSPEGFVSLPVGRLFAVSIVICALCDAVATFGLVLFALAGDPWDFYGFASYSLVLSVLFFPRYAQWEAWAQQQGG